MTQNKLSDFVVPAMLRRRDSNMDRQDIQDRGRCCYYGSSGIGVGFPIEE
jgi:hypothetical protein